MHSAWGIKKGWGTRKSGANIMSERKRMKLDARLSVEVAVDSGY